MIEAQCIRWHNRWQRPSSSNSVASKSSLGNHNTGTLIYQSKYVILEEHITSKESYRQGFCSVVTHFSSQLFCINLLLLACSLFYSWSEKKYGKDLKPSLWNQSCFVAFVVFTMISLFPLCTSIVPFHIFLGTHTCEDSISWIKVKLLGKSYYLIKTKILLSLSLTLCTECHIKS